MKTLILVLMVLTSGCASMASKIKSEISVGDSEERLIEVMGKPDAIYPSTKISGALGYDYRQEDEVCGFTVDDHIVKLYRCRKLATKPNVISKALSDMGQSMSNQRYVNCTSNTDGTMTQTTCH